MINPIEGIFFIVAVFNLIMLATAVYLAKKNLTIALAISQIVIVYLSTLGG